MKMMMLLFNYIINVFISTESSLYTVNVENDSERDINNISGQEIRCMSALDAISITVLDGRISPQGFELDLYVPNQQAEQNQS